MGVIQLTSSEISINNTEAPSESFLFSPTTTDPQNSGLNSSWRVHDSDENMFYGGTKADSNGGYLIKSNKYGSPSFSILYKDQQSYFYGYVGCLDSSGNIYIPLSQYNSTSPKVGVIKLNSSGVLQFQRTMTVTASSSNGGYGFSCSVDNSGNFFVAGGAKESGSSTLMPYVVKFDSSGNTSWQRRLQTTSISSLDAIYTQGSNVILSDGSVVLGGYYYTSGAGTDYNTLLTKYDSSTGNLSWQKAFSSGTNIGQQIVGLTKDSSDNIYALVYSEESPAATFILKYNSSGTLQWQRRVTKSALNVNAGNWSICIAPDGNIVVGMGVQNTGLFILTYNQSGVLQWTKKLVIRTGTININISGLSIDGNGFLHIGTSTNDYTSTSGNASAVIKVPYGNLSTDLNASIVKFSYQYTTSTGEVTDSAGSGTEPIISFTNSDFSSPYTYSGSPGNNNGITVSTTSYAPGIIKQDFS